MSQTSGASPSPPGAAMAADPAGDPAPMATGLPPVGPSPAPVDPAPGSGPGELAEPAAAHRRAPAGARAGSAPAYADAFVDAHNQRRAPHCAPPLAWSAKLAQLAQQWANSLRDQGCKFAHSGGSTGENLAAGTIGLLDPEAVVKMWYDEISQYRFPSGGFSMQTGHFTQVVWRGTSQVGCGHSQCKGLDIWVCEYDPPGNWEGQYRDNVLPKSCKK
jgi:uncharacterized protein YkwD